MARYLFDCETNGLLDTLTCVHSLVLKDMDTGFVISCTDHAYHSDHPAVTVMSIKDGLHLLEAADLIVGHNVIKFDIPALTKVYPWFEVDRQKVRDTLVLSRLIWPDIKEMDFAFARRNPNFPKKLIGRHSLESWGWRLGNFKGDYGKETHNSKDGDAWARWSSEMQEYCEQDVEVTATFWKKIMEKKYSEEAMQLEHDFCWIILDQETHGFHFDVPAAMALYGKLAGRRSELDVELQAVFPPWETRTPFIPKVNNKARGYVKGEVFYKVTTTAFNPDSRRHIAFVLGSRYGWEPTEKTAEGDPKVDETVLSKLPYPEVKLLLERLMLTKRLGQLGEGREAWLKSERNGRIHGEVITNGAVTGRCTHRHPNVAQVPSVGAPYGAECRALFHAPRGYKQVGADASGLELRCLAHYMARYDEGEYIKVLLEGDIHWANVQAMGLTQDERDPHNKLHTIYRNGAKTFIYAFLYGAGDEKAGKTVYDIIISAKAMGLPYETMLKTYFGGNDNPGEDEMKSAGRKLKTRFLKSVPALKRLREDVAMAVKSKGWLKGLDGRRLSIRSPHAALNTLLQSAGALSVKLATVYVCQYLVTSGYVFGKDFALVAHIHDEMQFIAKEGIEDEVGKAAVEAIRRAGEHFGFRCPLDGEYKVGRNWADTH